MDEDSESKRQTTPPSVDSKSKLISINYEGDDGPLNFNRISDFRKESKYVDASLKFDDGQLISCHRCILASASGYFDSLFSNGMKESGQDVIHVGNNSSSIFATALDYVYTGRCSFEYDNFFELLLLANMMEFKDLEKALLFYLTRCRMTVKGSISFPPCEPGKTRNNGPVRPRLGFLPSIFGLSRVLERS